MAVIDFERLMKDGAAREQEIYRLLEVGNILLFSVTPFELTEEERAFLLQRRQARAGYHKNIAYRPSTGRVTGAAWQTAQEQRRLRTVLCNYSQRVMRLVAGLLPRYATRWRIDLASFRPQEEAMRRLSRFARNDLLHVDSFPTRPTHGDRILRVFTNVNPGVPRVWRTGEAFPELAQRFAISSGILEKVLRPGGLRPILSALRSMGDPGRARSPYDEFMLRFHNFLKKNDTYQESANARSISFPPGSSWMVFTDGLTHAVTSGQYALEQTFLTPLDSLLLPEQAPIRVLESIAGKALR